MGGTRFDLYPAHGGETDDALVIHLPDRGVTFVGDAFMPYFALRSSASAEQAAALDLVAGGSTEALGRAVTTLTDRGDHALALRLADLALARHPANAALVAARSRALTGLRLRHQFNPFKFIVYSELAGAELPQPP